MMITISIETENVGAKDLAVLSSLVGALGGAPATATAPEPAPEPEPATAPKKSAPKKSAPKKPEPEPEPEPAPEPETAGESEEELLARAVETATRLLSEGQMALVKTALKNAGSRRVSELSGDALKKFLAEVSD